MKQIKRIDIADKLISATQAFMLAFVFYAVGCWSISFWYHEVAVLHPPVFNELGVQLLMQNGITQTINLETYALVMLLFFLSAFSFFIGVRSLGKAFEFYNLRKAKPIVGLHKLVQGSTWLVFGCLIGYLSRIPELVESGVLNKFSITPKLDVLPFILVGLCFLFGIPDLFQAWQARRIYRQQVRNGNLIEGRAIN